MSDVPRESSEFMTVADAAAEAEIGQEAVRNAIYRGRLASTRVYGRQLIRRSDFETWRQQVRMGRPPKVATGQPQ